MRNAKGFTLIELLIVIAIIAILAAVLIPNLLNARKNANTVTAQNYIRNVATEVEAQRDLQTGKLPNLGNCDLFVSNKPSFMTNCEVKAKGDNINFTVTAQLAQNAARYNEISFDSSTGQFTFGSQEQPKEQPKTTP